ncbi:4-hydroxy-tetrahydrodipicolinate synthase [Candidatus Nomurabacteria bacterium RIFCSPHIGHO2_01_FULL_37_25]|uniref:4-hydroxy-tetrahydrodipicolinate synthase n=1 Tax=Candidatus Nomurabacteria bacterium RIFCSPLOWO2_01_FULL_36_16 TaxID=1801767 RepID=A0A1F6WZF4_9BACT|nr:MAG: 4-hydroxy-tetrahydrodipicolinate synthase [Candidatus Nomurabacteria bacterium RIFCSPHIGHO2_01_FULL_37_25]OGI75358.1 MAG: 4-hydroxy-tetrahydrodipicolinate synthase [Candidatus Nomurabacteria bacterium RIFCSPHIGHO2_02_FULL_36_29]OGI87105.1 MAG: 4-hydroxy-tetrahydrodipicolinate synthase [Candidatus Nomurabacteria bacterium RIFCSPLOWO2_01_FULL_36_16]OGI95260.1 MAG: 4-hydroxy-tetrahydrodipicolinate synthase [Candidatus Nomurabacteria bacterium RIFCSPLOWO2_02_FULL_36_8]
MNKIKFFGSIPAIVTPFKKNGELDLLALEKLVKYQIEGGVDAIVVAGSTGEAATLNDEEYVAVIQTVVAVVKKFPTRKIRVPVIAGAGSNDTKKAIHFSKLAKSAGADGLLHVTPYYNKPTPNGLVLHFKEIAKALNMPIIIYNVPGRTGSNVSPQTIVRIAREVPEVVAVKEASGSLNQMMEIINEVEKNGPKDFFVLSGDDALALPLVSIGGKGCISVVCNEVPKLFSEMIHFALKGDFKEARKLHFKILPLMDVNFVESNPIPVKTALSLMGIITESLRLPLTLIEDRNKILVKKVLQELKLI